MIKRILLGLGGTPFTSVAIERAVELAQIHAAHLKAVTILDPNSICKLGPVPPGAGVYARKMCKNRLEVTHTQIEASIETLEKRCEQSNVPLDVEIETGDPFALIIAHARYHDLTIFGLRSIFEYQLADEPKKVLKKLLSKGVRPIIAVSKQFRKINKVMIAYNGSLESANAMHHFVTLNPWPVAFLDIVSIDENRNTSDALLKEAAGYCADHGYALKTHWRAGKASEQLHLAAQEFNSDMIVMGNSVRSILVRRVLGDTVLNTLTRSDRPLFLSQ